MEEIKQFRSIFKPTMSEGKYEGSYMLNAPYEEVVHYLEQAITKAREEEGVMKAEALHKALDEENQRARREEREAIIKEISESRLFGIMRHAFSRGSGHTYAVIKGLENVPNAILIVANENQKNSTGLPKDRQVSLNGARVEFFAGRRFPIVIDHYALQVLLEEMLDHLKSLKQ